MGSLGIQEDRMTKPIHRERRRTMTRLNSYQQYWYFVKGRRKPVRNLKDAYKALGLEFPYVAWKDVPQRIKDKIRREEL